MMIHSFTDPRTERIILLSFPDPGEDRDAVAYHTRHGYVRFHRRGVVTATPDGFTDGEEIPCVHLRPAEDRSIFALLLAGQVFEIDWRLPERLCQAGTDEERQSLLLAAFPHIGPDVVEQTIAYLRDPVAWRNRGMEEFIEAFTQHQLSR